MDDVHVSPYAGSWYPEEPEELGRLVADLGRRSLARTGACTLSDPVAFVVPHAGLIYSGTVAAAAYRCLAEAKPHRVILLGFAHHGGPPAVAIPQVRRISTPIGAMEIDLATVEELAAAPGFRTVAERQVCDHSIEIQLPLLIGAAPGASLVPLYVGQLDAATRDRAAAALARLAVAGTVFLASSDLTHYGKAFGYEPFPVNSQVSLRLRELDFSVIDAAGSLDAPLFLEQLSRTRATVCGAESIALLLRTLSLIEGGGIYQETLDYQTSGEITGDLHQSVSYGALGYFRRRSFELGIGDRDLLLESARRTLARMLETGTREPVPPMTITPALERRTGVFVSLHEGGRLRGCVGHHAGSQALAEAVPELTLAAALDDPRFSPMYQAGGEVEIEISVLTPLRRLRDPRGFHLGTHGVYLSCGAYRSLLLPQVARDQAWTAESFLAALARKAGLPADGWSRPDAVLHVFEAQVFSR
jgi:AmmeMemoRadiSam system protein B/AmmeMemoRadiSam system protein A